MTIVLEGWVMRLVVLCQNDDSLIVVKQLLLKIGMIILHNIHTWIYSIDKTD
jgi:hypothetical protein